MMEAGNLVAKYYRDADGKQPVREFIEGLDPIRRAAIQNQVERLNLLTEASPHLAAPWSSQVRGELRELRCHYGSEHYRILYRRSRRFVVLLHMFRKKGAKIPKQDIKIAEERWNDFKARMDAAEREPPRAVGRDAP